MGLVDLRRIPARRRSRPRSVEADDLRSAAEGRSGTVHVLRGTAVDWIPRRGRPAHFTRRRDIDDHPGNVPQDSRRRRHVRPDSFLQGTMTPVVGGQAKVLVGQESPAATTMMDSAIHEGPDTLAWLVVNLSTPAWGLLRCVSVRMPLVPLFALSSGRTGVTWHWKYRRSTMNVPMVIKY